MSSDRVAAPSTRLQCCSASRWVGDLADSHRRRCQPPTSPSGWPARSHRPGAAWTAWVGLARIRTALTRRSSSVVVSPKSAGLGRGRPRWHPAGRSLGRVRGRRTRASRVRWSVWVRRSEPACAASCSRWAAVAGSAVMIGGVDQVGEPAPRQPPIGFLGDLLIDERGLGGGQVSGSARDLPGIRGLDLQASAPVPTTGAADSAGRGRRRPGWHRHTATVRAGLRAARVRTRPPSACRHHRAASDLLGPAAASHPPGRSGTHRAAARTAPRTPALRPRSAGRWRATRRPGPGSRSWTGRSSSTTADMRPTQPATTDNPLPHLTPECPYPQGDSVTIRQRQWRSAMPAETACPHPTSR